MCHPLIRYDSFVKSFDGGSKRSSRGGNAAKTASVFVTGGTMNSKTVTSNAKKTYTLKPAARTSSTAKKGKKASFFDDLIAGMGGAATEDKVGSIEL